jgi:hypothetical protein
MTLNAELLKDQIVSLLGNASNDHFVVIGYKQKAQSSEETKDDYRSVQIFLSEGEFPKNKKNGPYHHDLDIRLDITASNSSKADLSTLEDPLSSDSKKITALNAIQNSSDLAAKSAMECLGYVFSILSSSEYDDFGFGNTVSNKKIKGWKNHGPLKYGKFTTVTISLFVSVSVEEDILGLIPIVSEDPVYNNTIDIYGINEESNDQEFDVEI